jgi:hypothetical protein
MHLRCNIQEPTLAYPSLGVNAGQGDNQTSTISREAEEPSHHLSWVKNYKKRSHGLSADGPHYERYWMPELRWELCTFVERPEVFSHRAVSTEVHAVTWQLAEYRVIPGVR